MNRIIFCLFVYFCLNKISLLFKKNLTRNNLVSFSLFLESNPDLLEEDDIFTFNEMLDENGNPDVDVVCVCVLVWTYGRPGIDYRVASLFTRYLTAIGIIPESLKSIGQF